MKNHRTLALRREVLTELTGAEMSVIVGASHYCVTSGVTHGASCDGSCPTVPLHDCSIDAVCIQTLLDRVG